MMVYLRKNNPAVFDDYKGMEFENVVQDDEGLSVWRCQELTHEAENTIAVFFTNAFPSGLFSQNGQFEL